MKRLLLLVMLLLPLGAFAQQEGLSKLIEQYSSKRGCTTVELSSYMMRNMGVDAGIDYMQIISIEDSELFAGLRKDIKMFVEGMAVMMAVRNGSDSVEIYSRSEEDGRITSMVIITEDGSTLAVVYMCGKDVKLNDVESLINL